MSPLTFLEEVTMVLLNEDTGSFEPLSHWRMSCVAAGAVLMDLALANRIDTDLESLILLDPTPLDDDILDPPLAEIAAESESGHKIKYWVERVGVNAEDLVHKSLERLASRGIIRSDEGGFWVRTEKVRRKTGGEAEGEDYVADIRRRIFTIINSDEIPDPREISIISLLNACEVFTTRLDSLEYAEVKERIELLSRMDLIGQSLAVAVQATFKTPVTSTVVPRRNPPRIGWKDCLFSRTLWSGNIPEFFAEQHRKHGPVALLKPARNPTYVISGAEANVIVHRRGRLFLRSKEYIEEFQRDWGVSRSVASMDGAEHFRMRKVMRDGTARTVVEDRVQELYQIFGRHVSSWSVGKTHMGEYACQAMVGEQISQLSTSSDITGYFDDLFILETRMLLANVFGLLPKFMTRTPSMNKKRQRLLDLYAAIHSAHSPALREGKRRDFVDDIFELHAEDPQFLPETDIGFALIAALIAGHYAGSVLSFSLYSLLTEPEIFEQLRREADQLFANGYASHDEIKNADIDTALRFVMEVMRLYCVIPVHMRHVMNAEVIGGYEVPPNVDCLVAYTASHYLEENFKDPLKFDIERYLPPRDEHKKPGAFRPFGVGTHTCLGQRFVELQMSLNVLLLVHHLELEMVPKNYKLKITPFPKLHPNKRFKFRIKSIRNPLPSEN
ncbi:MAG: cytochrome P450 [Gammaproteobacteria bacterium]|nr:cytochrome P450 [Gammaproteobacteria bacterium]